MDQAHFEEKAGKDSAPASKEAVVEEDMAKQNKFLSNSLFLVRKENILAIMTSLGLFIVMGIRCNLGPGFDILHNKSVAWIPTQVLLIDGAFHFGIILTQILGVYLSYKFPPSRIFSYGIVLSVFINLILPGAVNLGNGFLILLRLLQGSFEGIAIPALYRIWGQILVEVESFLICITFAGCLLGFAASFPISRCLAQAISWEASFYVFAVLAVVWYISWNLLVRDAFDINADTRYIIISATPEKFFSLPWNNILKSKPLWALCIVTVSILQSIYISITSLNIYPPSPQYHFYSRELSFSALCTVTCAGLIVSGIASDVLIKNNILSPTNVRKIVVCGGVGLLLPISLISHVTQNVVIITTVYSCSCFLFGAALSGVLVNCLDLGMYYAAASSGITSFVSLSICMIVYIVKISVTIQSNFNFVFLIFVGLLQLFGIIIYACYGSAEDQMWQKSPVNTKLHRSKSTDDLNSPTAIVEIAVSSPEDTPVDTETTSEKGVSFDLESKESTMQDTQECITTSENNCDSEADTQTVSKEVEQHP